MGSYQFELDNGKQIVLLAVPPIALALATAAVVTRWHQRSMKRINTLWEDMLCLAGLIMCLLVITIIYVMVFLAGEGLRTPDIRQRLPNEDDFNKVARYWARTQFAVDICWITSVIVVQLSFLKFYVRLYDTKPYMRHMCYALMGLVVAWYLWTMISWIFSCHPPGKCDLIDKKLCIAIGSLHALFNAAILFTPIPAIYEANFSPQKKMSTSVLFLLGCFCTILAILRIDCALPFFGDVNIDPIGASYGRILFSPLEIAVGIICSTVPNLKPISRWRRERPHLPKEGTTLRRLKNIRSSSSGSSTSNLNPSTWMPGKGGHVNAFVSLDDGGRSNERVRELGANEIQVTKEYNVGQNIEQQNTRNSSSK